MNVSRDKMLKEEQKIVKSWNLGEETHGSGNGKVNGMVK